MAAMFAGEGLLVKPVGPRSRKKPTSIAQASLHRAAQQLHSLRQQLGRMVVSARPGAAFEGDAEVHHDYSVTQSALRCATALLAAVVLQLGGVGSGAAQAFNLASVAEDRLLEFVRQVGVRVDSAVEAVKDVAAQVCNRQGLGATKGGCAADRQLPAQTWRPPLLGLLALGPATHRSCAYTPPPRCQSRARRRQMLPRAAS